MIAETIVALAFAAPGGDVRPCPVTNPSQYARRYGTRQLWTTLRGRGLLRARRGEDGVLGDKLAWIPDRDRGLTLTVSGRRLDKRGRMRVLGVNWGYSSTGKGSWASAVTFPSAGCYRITGRAGPTTLSYVVKVVSA